MDTQHIITERETTHGSFVQVAQTAQHFKSMFAGGPFTNVQHEALDLIATKLARLLHGDATMVDHWADIAGYAMLVVRDLDSAKAPSPEARFQSAVVGAPGYDRSTPLAEILRRAEQEPTP